MQQRLQNACNNDTELHWNNRQTPLMCFIFSSKTREAQIPCKKYCRRTVCCLFYISSKKTHAYNISRTQAKRIRSCTRTTPRQREYFSYIQHNLHSPITLNTRDKDTELHRNSRKTPRTARIFIPSLTCGAQLPSKKHSRRSAFRLSQVPQKTLAYNFSRPHAKRYGVTMEHPPHTERMHLFLFPE